MREQEFQQWMENEGKGKGIRSFYLSGNRRITNDEKINLDKEFQENNLERLLQLYAYSKADEKANRPNPTSLAIDEGATIYSILSIHRSALREYRKFCLSDGDVPSYEDPDDDSKDSDSESGATFGLERHMQDTIRENITQLEAGLKIIDNGAERKVTSGFIDILAKDKNGNFVVIELKAGKARNAVIAQILSYMVNIAETEGQKFEQVRGIIVASDFDKWVRIASPSIPNLELKSYSYTFDFKKET